MIDELEILHRYIDATVDPDPDLAPARRRLVAAIEDGEVAPRGWRPSRGSHRIAISRRTAMSLGGLVAVGVAAAVVALLVVGPPIMVRPERLPSHSRHICRSGPSCA
jgi:hypothetical protein